MNRELSTALMRCADLTRDHADMRSKRIGVEISPGGGLRVAATDGHVVALYQLPSDDRDTLGSFSVAGAGFPKWGASRWALSLHTNANVSSVRCVAHTKAGKVTAATAKKDRRVGLSNEPAVVWAVLGMLDGRDESAASVLEIGEIRDALEYLHADVNIDLLSDGYECLRIVAGPLVCKTNLAVPESFSRRRLNVGVLDRALDLLEGLDGGGLTWAFPVDPLDPVVIRTTCGRAEVWAMPVQIQ